MADDNSPLITKEVSVSTKDYADFRLAVANRLSDIVEDLPEDYEDEHKAFNLLTARLFAATTDDDLFRVTDNNDSGVDFYTRVGDEYEIFQCKVPEIDTLKTSEQPVEFDDAGVTDIDDAYQYLMSDTVTAEPNRRVVNLRNSIQGALRNDPGPTVRFYLSVFGALSPKARRKMDELATRMSREHNNVSLTLLDWRSIVREIMLQTTTPPKKFRIKLELATKPLMEEHEYTVVLAKAKSLHAAFEQFGWALFEMNPRAELRNSRVNRDIVKSLTHTDRMKQFHHLNNGILVFCNSYTAVDGGASLRVDEPQIVNGCQTVRSICTAYHDLAKDSTRQRVFDEKCFVQVKVIRNSKVTEKLISTIVVSTNNQNPMAPRNLKSNEEEQIRAAALFRELVPHKWFYQRKDGEFDSLVQASKMGMGSMRVSDFRRDSKAAPRWIDNADLAKAWLSFTGDSHRTMQTRDYFSVDSLYRKAFLQVPTARFWDSHGANTVISPEEEPSLFANGRPCAEQYLLSYFAWQFVKHYSVSQKENKEDALRRMRLHPPKEVRFKKDGSPAVAPEIINNALVTDSVFMVNNMLNNCREVLVEVYSFLLARRYGELNRDVARALLATPELVPLCEAPDFTLFTSTMPRVPENVLFSIYEFIRNVLQQLYVDIGSEYAAAPGRKSYLSSHAFIDRLKQKAIERDELPGFRIYDAPWKHPNRSFLASLPDIKRSP